MTKLQMYTSVSDLKQSIKAAVVGVNEDLLRCKYGRNWIIIIIITISYLNCKWVLTRW
jgi:hypothetical protein